MKRFIKYFSLITFIALMAWGIGFAYFLHEARTYKVDNVTSTNAIVVLGGERQQIETGIKLLHEGYAPILFIAGIAPSNDMHEFLKEHKIYPEQVIYGGVSKSTLEDMTEIQKFLITNEVDSVRMVASFYHMPRIMAIAHKLFPPKIIILPNPIFSNYNKHYALLIGEYNRYLLFLLFD